LIFEAFASLREAPGSEHRLTRLRIICRIMLDDYRATSSKGLHANATIDAIVVTMLADPSGASLDILEEIVLKMAADSDDNSGTMVMLAGVLGWDVVHSW
jgi:hypothetical protein